MRGLKAQGDGFVKALELHQRNHGQYPESAIEADVKLPDTRYGSWRYRVGGDRTWFELSVGDYTGFDPFTLYWSSKEGNWSLDR